MLFSVPRSRPSTSTGKDCQWKFWPRTFRDAILITRALGYRYLWIDSLCIIQDSEDWFHEASTMGDVYSNSQCTLAAIYAYNSTEGLLRPRDPRRGGGYFDAASSRVRGEATLDLCLSLSNPEAVIQNPQHPRSYPEAH